MSGSPHNYACSERLAPSMLRVIGNHRKALYTASPHDTSTSPSLRDDDLDTPVLLTPGRRVIGGHRRRLPVSTGRDLGRLDPVLHQEIPDRVGTALRELQVVGIRSDTIGVALDHHLAFGMLLH